MVCQQLWNARIELLLRQDLSNIWWGFLVFFSFLFGTRLKKILSSLGFYAVRMCYFVLSDELKSSVSDCKAFLCITLFFRHYSSFTWSDAQVNQYFRAPRPSHIASVSNLVVNCTTYMFASKYPQILVVGYVACKELDLSWGNVCICCF